jgi:hypothetical protein
MWYPSLDLVAYSALAIVALFPVIRTGLTSLAGLRLPAWGESKDKWQAQWVGRLVSLQNQCDERKMPAAAQLCRELTWEILGGGGQ